VSPEFPEQVEYPALFDAPPPLLKAYPRYTLVAEKVEAMVKLGLANSRMKDFYDIWLLSRLFSFEGNVLRKALENTFDRRRTTFPASTPFAFTPAFYKDPQKTVQWKAFIKKIKARHSGWRPVCCYRRYICLPHPCHRKSAIERSL
jgi:hypothetical protein